MLNRRFRFSEDLVSILSVTWAIDELVLTVALDGQDSMHKRRYSVLGSHPTGFMGKGLRTKVELIFLTFYNQRGVSEYSDSLGEGTA